MSDDTKLPAGERPNTGALAESQRHLRLQSGKVLKYDNDYSYTSIDGGATWEQGGHLIAGGEYCPIRAHALPNIAVQIQKGPDRGRVIIPFYLKMDGEHPDYTLDMRAGYAQWQGELTAMETHTHYPEMAGAYMNLSDDDGQSWYPSGTSHRRFMMGYFEDGHLGLWSCEEPVTAELKDGRLLCFIRSTCGRILKSYSSDGGVSWTKVEATNLAMSNSPCALATIPGTGDLVLIWNQMSAEEIKGMYRRGRLSLAISRDDGDTWELFRTLAQSPGIETRDRIQPPPFQVMVRGGSGPDEPADPVPDDLRHYHYSQVYFSGDGQTIHIMIPVSYPGGGLDPIWLQHPVSWLYGE